MNLSQLTEYAYSRYRIPEEHKWAKFPNFSVLRHPKSGKWVALLMHGRDHRTGEPVERCDIRCGLEAAHRYDSRPYVGLPARMRGSNWVGVKVDSDTDPAVVFSLLDEAIQFDQGGRAPERGISSPGTKESKTYTDTPIPPQGTRAQHPAARQPAQSRRPEPEPQPTPVVRQDPKPRPQSKSKPQPKPKPNRKPRVPARLRQMKAMYDYSHYRYADHDAWNFYRQARFMEDYEDNEPWDGYAYAYYPTYRDFSIPQLRGYFTWRTGARRGEYRPITSSLACLYIHELLCGVGASSPEDTLEKLQALEQNYVDIIISEQDLADRMDGSWDSVYRRPQAWANLHRWYFEYAVLKNLPRDTLLKYADPGMASRDRALEALHDPQQHSDDEIFNGLALFAGTKLTSSAFVKHEGEDAKHLFAGLWRFMTQHYAEHKKNIFAECFGRRSTRRWFPLSSAVYYEEPNQPDLEVVLSPVRAFRRRKGLWRQSWYWQADHESRKIRELVHEADRLFRMDRQINKPLRPNLQEAWATQYIKKFLEEEHQAAAEAEKQKVRIDFSELKKIRKDARETRDSLLTDEERVDDVLLPLPGRSAGTDVGAAAPGTGNESAASGSTAEGLDDLHRQILRLLLENRSADSLIADNHLMTSVVMDTINEAFFDEIGDNILEDDGSRLSVVEDYREDITKALGGVTV